MRSMKFSFVLLVFSILFSCKKKDGPSVPTVATATITEFNASTANGGGNISSDGGSLVLASGLCYSSINEIPTVVDDTTETSVLTGVFTSVLKNLASNTTYYVRAYATNKAGTGYGEVRSFTTGNEAPVANNVTINGEIKGDILVNVTYDYYDKEGNPENGTTIQWYRADDASGTGKISIEGATANTYRISDDDQGKVIWVGVTPRSSAGTLEGVEAESEKKGPVGEASTVTFMYNGQEITYGIKSSSKTGRLWLDRNLGAPQVPTAYNDYANMGDLFQWGRGADGHQLLTRPNNATDPTPINGNTTTKSITDIPASPNDKKFITTLDFPYDWRSTPNNNLWQGVNGINNPCPKGWRIPTIEEWMAEQFGSNPATNFAQLNLTSSGTRYSDGSFSSTDVAYYWSSTTVVDGEFAQASAMRILDFGGSPVNRVYDRIQALAVRCIKHEN